MNYPTCHVLTNDGLGEALPFLQSCSMPQFNIIPAKRGSNVYSFSPFFSTASCPVSVSDPTFHWFPSLLSQPWEGAMASLLHTGTWFIQSFILSTQHCLGGQTLAKIPATASLTIAPLGPQVIWLHACFPFPLGTGRHLIAAPSPWTLTCTSLPPPPIPPPLPLATLQTPLILSLTKEPLQKDGTVWKLDGSLKSWLLTSPQSNAQNLTYTLKPLNQLWLFSQLKKKNGTTKMVLLPPLEGGYILTSLPCHYSYIPDSSNSFQDGISSYYFLTITYLLPFISNSPSHWLLPLLCRPSVWPSTHQSTLTLLPAPFSMGITRSTPAGCWALSESPVIQTAIFLSPWYHTSQHLTLLTALLLRLVPLATPRSASLT